MKGLWCYILPIGCVILIFPSSGETAWHQNFFQSLAALFLGTGGSEHDNYKLSRHPDNQQSVSAPSSLQVHQGIPDVTTTASRLFRLELSDKTFSAPACYYEVHEVDGPTLPHWLCFNQTSNTLLGVPSTLDQGVYFIEITAYAKCSEGSIGTAFTATTNFLIQVQAANRLSLSKSHGLLGDELQPDGNHNIVLSMQRNEHNCDSSDIVIRNTIILDSTLGGLTSMQVEEQITVLYKLAQFLQRDVHSLTLTARRSGAIAKLLNVNILVAGPGNAGLETNNTGVEISWVLACGVFTQTAEVSRVMEHNVLGGRLAAELGYDIIGWYLSQEVPLGGAASRRKRQARNGFHTATPTPTPTVYVTTLPSRLSDISSESPVLSDAEKLTTETSLSTEEVTEEVTEGVTAEVTTADITTAVITPEAETEEPTTETPHQTTPITSDETTAREITTEQALTTEADITTGEVTTLKTEESFTQYANESVTAEVSTQGLPNQSPILLNPIDEINTKLGTYFQFLVPLATFYDREDGHTRHLELSLHDINMDPLAPDSWVQFQQDEQVIYGIPLEKDQSAEPMDFVLVATDKDGAQAVDVIQFPIDATSVVGVSHKFLMEFDVDFDSFVQETDTLINLLQKLSAYYKDEAPDLITVTGLREGSVMVEWSNNTLSKTECQNETILELFSTMVTDGAVDFYFGQAMLPEFPITDVTMEFLGACSPALVTEATTEFDNTTEHFISSGSDYNIWVVTIVPTIFVILLLLLAALLFCLWWYKKNQEQRGRYLLDSEKPTFAQNRKPILLPSELPYPDPVNRPKKPSILETEQQPYTYVNKSYQPPEDAQSLPPPYHLPKDGGYGDLGASPPPGYYPGEGAPPSYRLPPPYPSFPGSSEI